MDLKSYFIFFNLFIFNVLLPEIKGNDELKRKWDVWEDVPSAKFLRIFVFNLTNPDEFEKNEEKPNFQEVGPYVFKENAVKSGIEQLDGGSKVKYHEVKTYEFIPEESIGDEDDLITIVNLPLLTFAKVLSEVTYVGPNYFRSLIKAGETLTRRNERIGDVFYYGFDVSPYVKILRSIQGENAPLPKEFSGGRFGLFKGRNGTDDGEFVIGTGLTDESPYGKIFQWKNETNLKWWTEDSSSTSTDDNHCSELNGIQGKIFDPKSLSKVHVTEFDPDTCRPLRFSYHGRTMYKGIRSWKYIFTKDFLQDGKTNPLNACYCKNPGENGENCYKYGVIDLSPCRNGAPLVLSYPHFFHADESYSSSIDGMKPNKSSHNSYMIVEPKTGVVLEEMKRFQLNVHMKAYPGLKYLKNVENILLPIFWSERVYILKEDGLNLVKEELLKHPEELEVDDEGSWRIDDANDKEDLSDGNDAPVNKNSKFSFYFLVIFLTIFQNNFLKNAFLE